MGMKELTETYEYKERAAIRQFDGRFGEIEASQLAIIDIKERQANEGKKKPKPAPRPVRNEPPAKAENELRKRRNEVKAALLAAKNENKKDELLREYLQLCKMIIEKGVS